MSLSTSKNKHVSPQSGPVGVSPASHVRTAKVLSGHFWHCKHFNIIDIYLYYPASRAGHLN